MCPTPGHTAERASTPDSVSSLVYHKMGGATPSRILVLGIDGAGKTTFLNKIEKPKMDKATEPTESYEQRDMKQGGLAFSVWDVSGKSSTRSLWSSYYKQGNIGMHLLGSLPHHVAHSALLPLTAV